MRNFSNFQLATSLLTKITASPFLLASRFLAGLSLNPNKWRSNRQFINPKNRETERLASIYRISIRDRSDFHFAKNCWTLLLLLMAEKGGKNENTKGGKIIEPFQTETIYNEIGAWRLLPYPRRRRRWLLWATPWGEPVIYTARCCRSAASLLTHSSGWWTLS